MSFTVISNTEQVRDILCGAQQHNEHCKGYRWQLYMQDVRLRAAAVREETLKIIARARASDETAYQMAAE